jgi:hypothetical protein
LAGGAEGTGAKGGGVTGALRPAGMEENMRVNSPGAGDGGGGAENDGAGAGVTGGFQGDGSAGG